MIDAIERFFAEVDQRGPDLLPTKYSGTILFDLSGDHFTEQVLLIIDRGRVEVRREDCPADCVLRAPQDRFAEVLAGRHGIYAAVWRNLLSIEGQLAMITPLRELMAAVPQEPQPTSAPQVDPSTSAAEAHRPTSSGRED